eukprot:m.57062 g.57062  ORF g.57062 m.57062 type:complete len:183 (+) comp22334_c0_seq1:1557-2105(+)
MVSSLQKPKGRRRWWWRGVGLTDVAAAGAEAAILALVNPPPFIVLASEFRDDSDARCPKVVVVTAVVVGTFNRTTTTRDMDHHHSATKTARAWSMSVGDITHATEHHHITTSETKGRHTTTRANEHPSSSKPPSYEYPQTRSRTAAAAPTHPLVNHMHSSSMSMQNHRLYLSLPPIFLGAFF